MIILGSLLWTTTNGGIVPPTPPAPDSGVKPSGGIPSTLKVRGRSRKDVEQSRKRYGLSDLATDVIAQVAARQVESLEADEQKRFEELHRELTLRGVEFDRRYFEVLSEIRERLITEEIASRLRLKLREEEEIMVLLMMAAAVA